jgi:hypothetical protein
MRPASPHGFTRQSWDAAQYRTWVLQDMSSQYIASAVFAALALLCALAFYIWCAQVL